MAYISKEERIRLNRIAKNIPEQIVEGPGIVFQANVTIESLQGVSKSFRIREKYIHTGTVRKLVRCKECSNEPNQKLTKFYVLVIDGQTYHIDAAFVVEYSQPIDNSLADVQRVEAFLNPDIRYPENNDYIKEHEKITGLKVTYGPDYNIKRL